MAIAGKVSIVPRGEWQSTEVYTKLDLVTFNYNVYLALKESVGIEPTNEEYFMLLIENVVAGNLEDLQNQIDDIILGEISVENSKNSNNLGNQPPTYYATAQSVEDIVSGDTSVGNAVKLSGKDASNYMLKAQTIISSLPNPPTEECDYIVNNGDTSFPYAYGHLEIRKGVCTEPQEWIATYKTTGDDKQIYYNFYHSEREWQGWRNISDGGNATKLGNETAEQWQNKLDNIQSTSKGVLSKVGWYRVAEYEPIIPDGLTGSRANCCDLMIKRNFSNNWNEYHLLRFRSTHNNHEIISLDSKSTVCLVKKIRHTTDSTKSYLEIYYDSSLANTVDIIITSPMDEVGVWKAITPTLTSETVEGVNVTCEYDIPANAKPVTDLDIDNRMGNLPITISILKYAESLVNSVKNGVYNYHLDGVTVDDLPNANHCFDSVTIMVRYDGVTVILWGNSSASDIAVNYLYNSTWSGWKTLATTADLANYLPKTGGRLTGALEGESAINNGYFQIIKNSSSDADYGTKFFDIDKNGNYVALEMSAISKQLYFLDGTSMQNIFHTGIKPSGSYTGNGNATPRTINVCGDTCRFLLVAESQYLVLVGFSGAIAFHLTTKTIKYFTGEAINFSHGDLYMATDDGALNYSGAKYNYQGI